MGSSYLHPSRTQTFLLWCLLRVIHIVFESRAFLVPRAGASAYYLTGAVKPVAVFNMIWRSGFFQEGISRKGAAKWKAFQEAFQGSRLSGEEAETNWIPGERSQVRHSLHSVTVNWWPLVAFQISLLDDGGDGGVLLWKAGKQEEGQWARNTSTQSGLGQINSWCLEYPGGLGQLEAENTTLKRSQKKRI